VRDSRIGECLWREWTGEGYESSRDNTIIFYTDDHVDVEHDVVRRALASALQRDGSAVTLGQGYGAIEGATISQGYVGEVDGSREYYVCDEVGETLHGDSVDNLTAVTWVEVLVE
jgi:hypothetical protein